MKESINIENIKKTINSIITATQKKCPEYENNIKEKFKYLLENNEENIKNRLCSRIFKINVPSMSIDENIIEKIAHYETKDNMPYILKLLYNNKDKVNIGNMLLKNADETNYTLENYKLKNSNMYILERMFQNYLNQVKVNKSHTEELQKLKVIYLEILNRIDDNNNSNVYTSDLSEYSNDFNVFINYLKEDNNILADYSTKDINKNLFKSHQKQYFSFDQIKTYQETYEKALEMIDKNLEIPEITDIEKYIENIKTNIISTKNNYDFQVQKTEPFQKTYLINSRLHILKNELQTNINNVQTQVNVYGLKKSINNNGWFLNLFAKDSLDEITSNGKTYICTKQFLDNDIPDYANNKIDYFDDNAGISQVAKIIQANILSESMRNYYEGNIVIIGNQNIKPYDMINIQDSYTNMMGKAEVKDILTRFNQETGFTTEITPNMITETSLPHNLGKTWNQITMVSVGISQASLAQIAQETILTGGISLLKAPLFYQQQQFINNSFIKKQQSDYVLNCQSKNEQQHTIASVYNTPVIRPINLNNRFLSPKFDFYKYNSLDQFDIIGENLKENLDLIFKGLQK